MLSFLKWSVALNFTITGALLVLIAQSFILGVTPLFLIILCILNFGLGCVNLASITSE